MVMFHKNGQGYFEFEVQLQELESKTSYEFVQRIFLAMEYDLDIISSSVHDYGKYIDFAYRTNVSVRTFTFNKETCEIDCDHVLITVLEKLLGVKI